MVLSAAERRSWRYLVSWLQKTFPAAYPIRVRTRRIRKGDGGDTILIRRPRRFFDIRISDRLRYDGRVDALLHEWAHALNWAYRHDRGNRTHHDESWGVYFGKVYAAYEREIEGAENGEAT